MKASRTSVKDTHNFSMKVSLTRGGVLNFGVLTRGPRLLYLFVFDGVVVDAVVLHVEGRRRSGIRRLLRQQGRERLIDL